MSTSPTNTTNFASPWPHRWAVVLACATFPLLWVGGLVTTTDAGMAVPDWPTTYGYNLFLYPWQWWLAAPWDLFVEHGHRLLGATAGLITIGLLTVLWRREPRAWLRWLGVAALALVILQGVLGGMRVLFDERTLAMFHGITGPLFFALVVAMVVCTSHRWRDNNHNYTTAHDRPIRFLTAATCLLVYLQIVFGSVVRHVPVAAEPDTFVVAVRFHLFLAAVLTLHVAWLVWLVCLHARGIRLLFSYSLVLAALLLLQLSLGAGTWVLKFATPTWAPVWISTAASAVPEGGWVETHVITAHVAVGSLLLGVSTALALWSWRLLPGRTAETTSALSRLETAL